MSSVREPSIGALCDLPSTDGHTLIKSAGAPIEGFSVFAFPKCLWWNGSGVLMIIRRSKKRKFTSLSNQLLQDHNLSFAVRGLLAYLLSKPDDWECRITDIEREGNIGTTARRTMMIEAEKAGYLTFERTRNERGQFFSAYTVHEEPVDESELTFSWKSNEKPSLDDPAADEPPPENPRADDIGDIVNTEAQKTDLQKTERERGQSPRSDFVEAKPANQPFSPNDNFTDTPPQPQWSTAERFVLKACELWDELTNQEKPVVETNWKTKQSVQVAGRFITPRLSVENRIGGTPKLFQTFWRDTLNRTISPRPDYVVEQWEAYDRWLIDNHEPHRRLSNAA